jgi:hypothetical protein
MTKQERARLPRTMFVTWCVFCEKPDYAVILEADIENRTCPYCEHRQDVVGVRVDK